MVSTYIKAKETLENRMYIQARVMNCYTPSSIRFKWYALAMTILFEEGYGGYWYTKGTKRYI